MGEVILVVVSGLLAAVALYDLRDWRALLAAAAELRHGNGDRTPLAPAATHTGPAVDIVIPIFNMGRTVTATIESVRRSTYQDLRLIVVDDGSTDETTWATLRGLAHRIDHLERVSHGGKAHAANHGARLGTGAVILFLDADSTVVPDFVEQTLALFAADPATGAIDFVQRVANPQASFWTRQATFERALLALRPDNFGALFAMRRPVFEQMPFASGHSPQFDINTRLRGRGLLTISHRPVVFSEEPRTLALTFRRKRRWAYGFLEVLDRRGGRPGRHVLVPAADLGLVSLVAAAPLAPGLSIFAMLLYTLWTAKALHLATRLGLRRIDAVGYGVYMSVVNAAVVAAVIAFWRRRGVPWR